MGVVAHGDVSRIGQSSGIASWSPKTRTTNSRSTMQSNRFIDPCTQRPPEALHLAACLRIFGFGVKQADAESCAERLEHLAAVRRAVVEIKCAGAPPLVEHALHHEREHLHFTLRRGGLNRNDVPAVSSSSAWMRKGNDRPPILSAGP